VSNDILRSNQLTLFRWDYQDTAYLDALKHMTDLQKAGKIKHIALTNFDTDHMKIIVDNGIKIVSNQVSYSLIDLRPEKKND